MKYKIKLYILRPLVMRLRVNLIKKGIEQLCIITKQPIQIKHNIA